MADINTLKGTMTGNTVDTGMSGEVSKEQFDKNLSDFNTKNPPKPNTPPPSAIPTANPNPTMTPASPTGLDSNSYLGLMNTINGNLQQNNSLVDQKNAIQKHLFDQPLTPDELKKLPPDVAQVIQSGDQERMKLQLKIINDTLQGRNDSVAKSIGTLTTGYENHQKDIQTALNNLMTYSVNKGVSLKELVKAYAPVIGTDLADSLSKNLSSVTDIYQKSALQTTAIPSGSFDINIPTGTIASQTNNPLNIKYSSTSPAGGEDSGLAGKDGGTFAAFGNPNEGLQAGIKLLSSGIYSNLSVDEAMKKWSNGGYGAEVSPSMNPNQTLSSLSDSQLQQLVTDMAKRESGSILNQRPIDNTFVTSAMYPTDETKNKIDPVLGVTPLALYNDATDYLFTDKNIQTYTGGLSSGTKQTEYKDAVKNKQAAIADELGLTREQAAQIYKGNSSAIKQNVERLARVDSISKSLVNQFPRLETLADTVKSQGIDLTEQDIQSGSAKILAKFGSPEAASYVELLNTVRADYAAQNAALAGSRGGEFFANSAMEAIPLGYTGDQYKALSDTILKSAQNVKDGIQSEVTDLSKQFPVGPSSSSSDTSSPDLPALRIKYNYK